MKVRSISFSCFFLVKIYATVNVSIYIKVNKENVRLYI